MRTPKVGEQWVWLPCKKHQFHQLRDLVVIGRDHEDQSQYVQELELEHIRCGCRFPADDPARALADLRADEARHEAEMKARLSAILYSPRQESSTDTSCLVALLLLAMVGIVTIYFLFLFHG